MASAIQVASSTTVTGLQSTINTQDYLTAVHFVPPLKEIDLKSEDKSYSPALHWLRCAPKTQMKRCSRLGSAPCCLGWRERAADAADEEETAAAAAAEVALAVVAAVVAVDQCWLRLRRARRRRWWRRLWWGSVWVSHTCTGTSGFDRDTGVHSYLTVPRIIDLYVFSCKHG